MLVSEHNPGCYKEAPFARNRERVVAFGQILEGRAVQGGGWASVAVSKVNVQLVSSEQARFPGRRWVCHSLSGSAPGDLRS